MATCRIGSIFSVPGQRETYRPNGTAGLTSDPELLDWLAVSGKPALMATIVEAEEVFFYCGIATIRAKRGPHRMTPNPTKTPSPHRSATRTSRR